MRVQYRPGRRLERPGATHIGEGYSSRKAEYYTVPPCGAISSSGLVPKIHLHVQKLQHLSYPKLVSDPAYHTEQKSYAASQLLLEILISEMPLKNMQRTYYFKILFDRIQGKNII